MDHGFGLDIPETLADVCRPDRLALVIYDMQVGIVRQLPNGAEVTRRVAGLLEAARAGGLRVFHTRHFSLPSEAAGVARARGPGLPGVAHHGVAALVPLVEELDQLADLDLVVALVRAGTELDFLDLDLLLLELRFVRLLLLLVLELAVVHQATDRRHGGGSNLYQINLCFFSHSERVRQAHDTERFTFNTDQTYLDCVYFTVDPVATILSDGFVL